MVLQDKFWIFGYCYDKSIFYRLVYQTKCTFSAIVYKNIHVILQAGFPIVQSVNYSRGIAGSILVYIPRMFYHIELIYVLHSPIINFA